MAYKSRLPEITAKLESNIAQVVQRTGFRIEAGAKARARVKTGYMRGQIRWIPFGPLSGEVIGGAFYTIHNEFGTIHMSAQPMFVPAAEEVRPIFIAEMRAAIKDAVE